MKRILAAMFLCLLPLSALAQAVPAEGRFADPAQESRVNNLQRQLRCMVCQGQSIDDSDAELAAELRHVVREQLAAGRSDSEILEYLHSRYGDFVLMQPPLRPYTWLLWLAPVLALAGAGAVALTIISRAKKLPDSSE